MKKAMLILMTGAICVFYANGVFAATVRCTVTEVTGESVVLDCGKNAVKIKVGDKVKIKTVRKAAVEGC